MTKSTTATATAAAPPVPKVQDVDLFLRGLIDPKARLQAEEELDKKIAAKQEEMSIFEAMKKEELNQLEAAKRALQAAHEDAAPVARTVRRSKSNGASKGGRPAGQSANHGPAIVEALRGNKSGLVFSALVKAISDAGHEISPKTLSTYLQIMQKRGDVIKDGTRGSYNYRLKK